MAKTQTYRTKVGCKVHGKAVAAGETVKLTRREAQWLRAARKVEPDSAPPARPKTTKAPKAPTKKE